MEEETKLSGFSSAPVKSEGSAIAYDKAWTARYNHETKARKIFESLLRVPGEWDGRKYVTKNIQTYWRWFRLGWQMRGHNDY